MQQINPAFLKQQETPIKESLLACKVMLKYLTDLYDKNNFKNDPKWMAIFKN